MPVLAVGDASMSDVGESVRVILRMLESLSPTTDNPTENELRFYALGEIRNKLKRLASNYIHAEDEMGE